jgi:hypothetical protein
MDEACRGDPAAVEVYGCLLERFARLFGYQVRRALFLVIIRGQLFLTVVLDSLAYMEMYMAIAYIIRRFDLEIVNTTAKDMVWDDMVVPQFHGEFKVLTKRRTD